MDFIKENMYIFMKQWLSTKNQDKIGDDVDHYDLMSQPNYINLKQELINEYYISDIEDYFDYMKYYIYASNGYEYNEMIKITKLKEEKIESDKLEAHRRHIVESAKPFHESWIRTIAESRFRD